MLRGIFDGDAELYDRVRPRYPSGLIDALVQQAQLSPRSRVLEVAPGTGQLTVPLARVGGVLTAVELGPALAAVARRNLAPYPRAHVEVAEFEAWPLPPEPYDLVVCATAFHWLDPDVRVPKMRAALRGGGTLAVVTTEHVAGGSSDFWVEVQGCYERWDPDATEPGLRLPEESTVRTDVGEIERAHGLGPVTVRRFARDITYTADQYIDVLRTYSGHRALDHDTRAGLLRCVRELIDGTYGGFVVKRYLHELITASAR
ncbi:class I SAM-dependent methyltransferase [Streptomyces durmitorensis]|uniref:Class I SAM-dependent methyltransferase n=1 Tax=Streptomyces durmitorensis TaxID=319947 RepID=A0ABY4PQT2_9ACTN|nr:class I SAM-dependent methyltransferase [Streptomyces durmitorensis]UQT56086.1 class I SAM-dependent methyltransferase [Streptomyces durmitorensis]